MINNILVISDSDANQNGDTASALAREGFRVTTCSDDPKALLKADEFESDVIIIDRPLAADGFKLCSQLRQVIDVPIIIMDKAIGAAAWPEAVKSGADLYLAKPLRHKELTARLRAIRRRTEWSLGERQTEENEAE